jgi:hypothetical protein
LRHTYFISEGPFDPSYPIYVHWPLALFRSVLFDYYLALGFFIVSCVLNAMVGGGPVTPLVSTIHPMVFAQSMGTNTFLFLSGMPNNSPETMPWTSNSFSFSMSNMNSHFSSFVLSYYVNPSFGFGGMMPPYSNFNFGGGPISQPYPMVGGWNNPSFGANPSFIVPGSSAQIGGHSTYYIPSIYPYSTMMVPRNDFLMDKLPLSSQCSIHRESVL